MVLKLLLLQSDKLRDALSEVMFSSGDANIATEKSHSSKKAVKVNYIQHLLSAFNSIGCYLV